MDKPDTLTARLTIPDWCVEDRPREKYAQKGAASLSDAELLAIILRTGTSTESAVDLSKRILHQCDNKLNKLEEMSLQQLLQIHGIGQAKAVTLKAAFELGHRIRSERVESGGHIHSSTDVLEIMQKRISHLRHEEFWAIFLNQAARILHTEQIGKGGLTSTTVDVRLIAQKALLFEATAIIVCHNHPSGSVKPSQADIKLTRDIQKALEFLNISLLDHIILYKNSHFSFLDNGIL